MNPQELQGLYESYLEVYDEGQQLDEAEGSYGQTPKATSAYASLARSRSGRGSGKKLASKHAERSQKTAPGHSGKRSSSPYHTSGDRENMTQSDRDYARGRDEYGHTGYDPDYDGGPSAPGGKPKGKKLERQKKTGVSAESYDLYDIILSHLLDEGYAETQEAAEAIMVNMSEEWRESIVEEVLNEDPITGALIGGALGIAAGAKGASYAAKKTKRLRDYPKNFVKGIVDPRTYFPKKKKTQKESN